MNDKDKIIERVRKLMAMAADAGSPNEAAIAARRARKLMDQYQIGLGDLEASEFGTGAVGNARTFIPLWEQSLAISIAKLNDCNVRFNRTAGSMKVLQFQGFKSDVQVAEFMFHYLTEAGKSQCSAFMKAEGYTRYNARVGDSFKTAFGRAVGDKINDMLKEREQAKTTDGKGLVVVKRAMVNARFGAAQYGRSRKNMAAGQGAYQAGAEAGRRTNITTGIGSAGRKAIGT